MLQRLYKTFQRILRYDPGALRLVRGVHLMLTVVAAALLADRIASFADGKSGFTLAVLAAAAGAHCLLFTPISTRKQEAMDLFRLGSILVALLLAGAIVENISGKSASTVLQAIWIGIIAVGFGIEGLGPFWLRAGRMVAIFWLFVIMASASGTSGLWMPAMGALGVAIAIVVRVGFWRPSPERTFLRVENTNRRAMAEYLHLAANGRLSADRRRRITLADLASLRTELELSIDLTGPRFELRGLAPEAAAMMQLALEVVRDAVSALTPEGRAAVTGSGIYQNRLGQLQDRIKTGEAHSGEEARSVDWSILEAGLEKNDQFQFLRIAQAFQRLWLLADGKAVVADEETGQAPQSGTWWQRISWRLALQASVAASIGYGIGIYFNLSHAYWITITVIVVLCSSLGATIRKTAQRTLGTAVGFIFAIALEPVLAGYPELRLALVILLLPPIIVLFERNYGIAVGIISFLVLIGLQTLTGLPAVEFWARLYDTLIGAGVGLAAAWVLLPNKSGGSVKGLATSYLASCSQFLKTRDRSSAQDESDYFQLKETAAKLVSTARTYRTERAPWSSFISASSDLDTLVLVLADYIVLYRQARATIQAESEKYPSAEETEALVARMDKRVLDEIEAVLQGRSKQVTPGLADDWLAAMPVQATANAKLMTDWVAMLYYGRKVIRCLDGLRQEGIWSVARAKTPGKSTK